MTTQTTEAPIETIAPAETTKPLKLSEAIRIGGMVTKQLHGDFGDSEKTCAIGAANVAFGREPADSDLISVLDGRKVTDDPCSHLKGGTNLSTAIIHLNDSDKWPREKIADWLEGIGL